MGTANFDYSDETVIVTGGSAGIGRAIALGFGRAGATVAARPATVAARPAAASTPFARGHQRASPDT